MVRAVLELITKTKKKQKIVSVNKKECLVFLKFLVLLKGNDSATLLRRRRIVNFKDGFWRNLFPSEQHSGQFRFLLVNYYY